MSDVHWYEGQFFAYRSILVLFYYYILKLFNNYNYNVQYCIFQSRSQTEEYQRYLAFLKMF